MEVDILNFITTIRESFGSSISIYTMGNCYQFYEILKVVFTNSEPYFDGNHVWTKIDGNFYDIRGKLEIVHKSLRPLIDTERIKSLCVNKWSDERRVEYSITAIENYKNKVKLNKNE